MPVRACRTSVSIARSVVPESGALARWSVEGGRALASRGRSRTEQVVQMAVDAGWIGDPQESSGLVSLPTGILLGCHRVHRSLRQALRESPLRMLPSPRPANLSMSARTSRKTVWTRSAAAVEEQSDPSRCERGRTHLGRTQGWDSCFAGSDERAQLLDAKGREPELHACFGRGYAAGTRRGTLLVQDRVASGP